MNYLHMLICFLFWELWYYVFLHHTGGHHSVAMHVTATYNFIILAFQMLTVRNGLGFHPNFVLGSPPPMQLPMDFNVGNVMPNTSRGADTLSSNQEVVMQTAFRISDPNVSSQRFAIPSITNNSSSAFDFGLESSIQNNYGVLNHLPSAKVSLSEDYYKL